MIAVGEPMFGGAAEEALETQLARHGLDLYDERGILELRDAGGAAQIAPSSLLGMVAGRGVDVLVLIDVEPMGQRELDALGRYAYATTRAFASTLISPPTATPSAAAGARRSSTRSPTP